MPPIRLMSLNTPHLKAMSLLVDSLAIGKVLNAGVVVTCKAVSCLSFLLGSHRGWSNKNLRAGHVTLVFLGLVYHAMP